MQSLSKTHFSTRKLVISAMFSSISIFLGLTGLGFIKIPPVNATIMHIPVIIAAILEGPIVGAIVGLIFGLFSMYQAVTTPTVVSFIFLNPIIALLPRILIGITSYYTYLLISKKFNKIGIGVSAAIGTFTNTFLVLYFAYILYGERLASAFEVSSTAIAGVLAGIGTTNGIPEIIISTLVTIPVVIAIKKLKR